MTYDEIECKEIECIGEYLIPLEKFNEFDKYISKFDTILPNMDVSFIDSCIKVVIKFIMKNDKIIVNMATSSNYESLLRCLVKHSVVLGGSGSLSIVYRNLYTAHSVENTEDK